MLKNGDKFFIDKVKRNGMSKDGEEPTKCFYKFEDMAELLDRTSLGLRKKQITSGL
ncbi:MAG TPA: hypothetical protein GX534_03000 [Thermoanaerobacterales bacterium]|nr:hypothetical protein [Thermoanaerobacterales bacterium]